MNNIFDLVYSDYDLDQHNFVQAPTDTTVEEFQKLCDSLMPKAGYRAALKKSSPKIGGWIYWSDVVEALVSLLEQQGYQRITLGSYILNGGVIVRPENSEDNKLGYSIPVITYHNDKIQKKLDEERKAKKQIRLGMLKKKIVQIIK